MLPKSHTSISTVHMYLNQEKYIFHTIAILIHNWALYYLKHNMQKFSHENETTNKSMKNISETCNSSMTTEYIFIHYPFLTILKIWEYS